MHGVVNKCLLFVLQGVSHFFWTLRKGFATTVFVKPLPKKHFEKAKDAGAYLDAAAKPLRILGSLEWPDDVRNRFLKTQVLPEVTYVAIDVEPSLEAVRNARNLIDGDHVVFEWLGRLADDIEVTAHMIAARGTREFHTHSKTIYGEPTRLMLDKQTRVIDMARHMDEALEGLDIPKLVVEGYEVMFAAKEFAQKLRPRLTHHFGKEAPKVILVDNLSAKATATSKTIRVRTSAMFSDRDIHQLLQHEALVHSATGLNGKAQQNFPILGRSHAGTTQIQEGLAVFAEVISGSMDPVRFRRLADRVIAIQMSIEGADFKEVFDFYMARTDDADQSYDNTRRIFRGGLITGGAPFTKDMVYLNGLLRVHNFMRSVVKLGRADLIRVLFTGKMDIEDIPAIAQLAASDRVDPPKFMPPWAKDLRFLVSYLAYSSFLNQVKMPGFQAYYQEELADVPVVWDFVE